VILAGWRPRRRGPSHPIGTEKPRPVRGFVLLTLPSPGNRQHRSPTDPEHPPLSRMTPFTPLFATAVLAALLAGPARAASDAAPPLETIATLDVPRYLGTWHQVALYPNRFQSQCAAATTARYALRDDGRLEVTNRCRRADGRIDQAVGAARQIGGATSPKLQVRFAPAWLGWLPMVWGDYWVIDLDAAYQLAAVSEPKREYLWILSRTPTPDPAAYDALLQRLAARGFDLQRLQRSPAD
jgi:apolipoprotein D and lipocalin family protein